MAYSYRKSSERPYDYIFDPLFTTGNIIDIHRKNKIISKKTAEIGIQTNFNLMFSDSIQRAIVVKRQNPLPIDTNPQNSKL